MDRSLLERYFRGSVTDEERSKIADWVKGSATNLKDYMALRRMYDKILVSEIDAEGGVRTSKNKWRRRLLAGISIAASVAVLAGLFLHRTNVQSESGQFNIHTVTSPVGQQTHTILSDGTQVWLNSNSVMEVVDMSCSERRIRLQGEAYLDVARDESRPFSVETEKMVVTVLGTEFDVNSYGKIHSVVLVNGKVKVTDTQEGTSLELNPGHRFEFDTETGEKNVMEVDTENFVSWTNGYLKFESVPLKQLILQLQDFYGIATAVAEDVDDSLLVSGKLELRRGIDKALESLCLISSVTYDWTSEDAITITGK